ncbi:MAG: T9SS C-terminal target domain-containing protein [Crocinitomicaceae bacterium]|nr:T9SS C-terminal target domain-containing protein [Crocinitomicaceae bacterium]
MMKQIITVVIGATTLLWSNDALSLKKEQSEGDKPSGGTVVVTNKGANCSPATAKLTMQFNDVSALIEQGGSMWTNRATTTAAYEIPKGSGLKVIYAGALWMGGKDQAGQLKLAGLTFRTGNDFWPGPLSITPGSGNLVVPVGMAQPLGPDAIRDFGAATIDPDQCLFYDKFYTIKKSEVIQFATHWTACDGPNADPTVCAELEDTPTDVLNRIYAWPAHGNAAAAQDYWLAPFYDNPDGNNGLDGIYNPDDGDYPWYDDILNKDDIECGVDRRISLFGDETHWWVFNDNGNIHGESNGDPIGMEVRAQAFAFATNDEVNRMTFYNYEMINRGTQTLEDTYFAQYIDADVGNAQDDFTGCDVSRGLGYMFNGDNFDESESGNIGYGENPPAVGCDFFEGPYQDADGVDNPGPYFDEATDAWITPTVNEAIAEGGIVYSGIGVGYSDGLIDNERYGMRLFTYYTNGGPPSQSDPNNAVQFYNYMSGFWADGQPMFYGGTGHPSNSSTTTTRSNYMFPGDSDPLNWATEGIDLGFDWSEVDRDGAGTSNQVGDRRFVQSAGPFTLTPGAVNNITVGIVYGRGTDGGLWASVDAMKNADTKAQALFDACFRILEPPNAPKLTIQELENSVVLMLTNPLGSNNYNETYHVEDEINIVDPSVDRYYTFEGYQIYQLVNDEASVSDIFAEDAGSKARIVAQCDISNGIEDIINFEFDEGLGYSVPTLKVDADNDGIQHSFLIAEDQFAQGDKKLINHKTYYYVAIAYAHNEFLKYDPNDAGFINGQKIPYISSRLGFDGGEIKAVSAIPHNPAPEADGTLHYVAYGNGPQITRYDGYGNGGYAIDLNASSINTILTNGIDETPTYDYGRGPINIKVVDPLNVADGEFILKFRDYDKTLENAADTASWVIYRYVDDIIVDSVDSDQTIGVDDPTVSTDPLIETDNEQIIPQWGISVQITQRSYYFPDSPGSIDYKTTDVLESSIDFVDSSKQWLMGVPDNDAFYPTNWIRAGEYDPTHGTAAEDDDDCTDDTQPFYRDYTDPCNYPDELNVDTDKNWAKILGGTIAPHRLVGYQGSYAPMAYYGYNNATGSGAPTAYRSASSVSFTPSIDIVLTSDQALWTRCPVIELGRDSDFNVGGAEPGEMRKSPSLGTNGLPDGTGEGMSWFPGYAIDVESGARLYMAFGENSFLVTDNGSDMMWNPTERLTDDSGNPVMGGMHPVYVFNYHHKDKNNYIQGVNYPYYDPSAAQNNAGNQLYNDFVAIEGGDVARKKVVYSSISWVAYPMIAPGYTFTNPTDIPTTATISVRVNKEYKNFSTGSDIAGGPNGGMPMYGWDMQDIRTELGSSDELTSVLDLINIVPNPYYAYSEYENNRLDTRVKITNLPERCTIKIFTVNGKLVRTFKKDSPITSLDWDLNNHKNIPVAGGVYLIHIDVPDIGEVILKFFGGMRQVDLQGI